MRSFDYTSHRRVPQGRSQTRITRALGYFILFLFAYVMAGESWAESQPSLVDIYCQYVTLESHSAKTADSWAILEQHLNERKPFLQGNSTALTADLIRALEQCHAQYQDDFLAAEFLLDGRELISQNLRAVKTGEGLGLKRLPLSVTVQPLQVTTPEGPITVEDDAPPSPESVAADLNQREAQYEALWQNFLASVHQKLTAKASS